MGYDTEAIAILLKQTRNRDIRWAAVDLSSDGIPGGWAIQDGKFNLLLSLMPRRLTVLSVESGESAEVGDDGLRTWRPVGPPSPGP